MKRTYQPHNVRRARTHGFRARMATRGGRKVLEPAPQGPQAPRHDDLQEVAAVLRSLEALPMESAFGGGRRVRRHAEFVRAQKAGRRVGTDHFTLLVAAQPSRPPSEAKERATEGALRPPRLGIVVTRKLGGAVQRNRIKRLCRECFRTWVDLLPPGTDLIVIARPGADALGLSDVRREWERAARLLRRRAEEALARPGESHHPGGR